ncbi:MAG: response regulator [Desulforhopalus sp.]|nr:response regulator [Desulforhopalus sp.]
MDHAQDSSAPQKLSILIVDDSLVFRRFLRDIFEDCSDFLIIGEAQNGIEALDMVLKTNPSVILLDLEMPLMDGMTALQHLMIHRPTPTIMFSSLTEEGTARSYDTLKNGALDFICKDFIFQKSSIPIQKKLLIDKVRKAATYKVKAREPIFSPSSLQAGISEEISRVVFCEDCGHRETVIYKKSEPLRSINCSQCGDSIEFGFTDSSHFRRNTFITVLGGGEGSFYNLLEIIPRLDPEMGGALIAVVHQEAEHLNSFTEYLDANSEMKVIRAREGINIEAGNCYIASGHDFMHLKPYSAQLSLQRLQKSALNCGPLDILLASVSTLYKKKVCGVILSGNEDDGDKGMAILMKNGGTPLVLDGSECYCKSMGQYVLSKSKIAKTHNTEDILATIKLLHNKAKNGSVIGI